MSKIKYLARYMTGGPISDWRLIKERGGRIYSWARSDDKSRCQEIVSLPVLEFVRRWTKPRPESQASQVNGQSISPSTAG